MEIPDGSRHFQEVQYRVSKKHPDDPAVPVSIPFSAELTLILIYFFFTEVQMEFF